MKIFGKRILSIALTTCMLASTMIPIVSVSATDRFTDFPDNWSTEALTAAVNNGLLHGYEDSTIRAEGLLTRAEMAAVINRAFGAVIAADISAYKDVNPGAWYYDEIAKGVNMRTFVGGGDGYMFPDNAITREETFAVLARALVLSSDDTSSLDRFADREMISAWAESSLAALSQRGYINGDELSQLNPKSNITRAEFAVLMNNIFKHYYSEEGTYTGTIDGSVLVVNVEGVKLSNLVINGDLVIGDGAHIGEIYLENVTVNGRILVRGPQKPGKIQITKSTARDGIIVNNVNGTVYFDNYKTEAIFKNIVENTPTEFKTAGGSSGGSSGGGGGSDVTMYLVKFVDGVEADGVTEHVVNNYAVAAGTSLSLLGTLTSPFEMPKVAMTYTQANTSSTNPQYTHDVYQAGWFDSSRTEYTKDTIINSNVTLYPGWKEMTVSGNTTRFNIPQLSISTYYNPDDKATEAVTDVIFANRQYLINGLNQYEATAFGKPFVQRFITYPDKQIKMFEMGMTFKQLLGSTDNFKGLFDAQIEAGLNAVTDPVINAQLSDKVDEAFDKIAGSKEWDLKDNNMINLDLSLDTLFGGSLETMLMDTVTANVPAHLLSLVEQDIHDVVHFITTCGRNDQMAQDRVVGGVNITELVLQGLLGQLATLQYDDVDEHLDQGLVNILTDAYLIPQFEIAKANTYSSIEAAMISGEVLTGETFHVMLPVDAYRLFLIELDIAIEQVDPDDIYSYIPEMLKKVFSDAFLRQTCQDIIDDFEARIEEALATNKDTLDTEIRVNVNPIDDVLLSVYDRYIGELEAKLGTYYSGNTYLQQIHTLLKPDTMFDAATPSSTLTAYKLKSYDDYYDILEQVTLLSDDALKTFSEAAIASGDADALILEYVNLAYSYYEKLIDLANQALTYANVSTDIISKLPSRATLEAKKAKVIAVATALVNNPEMTAKEAIELGLLTIGATETPWSEFTKDFAKGEETVTIKNKTSIPDLE